MGVPGTPVPRQRTRAGFPTNFLSLRLVQEAIIISLVTKSFRTCQVPSSRSKTRVSCRSRLRVDRVFSRRAVLDVHCPRPPRRCHNMVDVTPVHRSLAQGRLCAGQRCSYRVVEAGTSKAKGRVPCWNTRGTPPPHLQQIFRHSVFTLTFFPLINADVLKCAQVCCW